MGARQGPRHRRAPRVRANLVGAVSGATEPQSGRDHSKPRQAHARSAAYRPPWAQDQKVGNRPAGVVEPPRWRWSVAGSDSSLPPATGKAGQPCLPRPCTGLARALQGPCRGLAGQFSRPVRTASVPPTRAYLSRTEAVPGTYRDRPETPGKAAFCRHRRPADQALTERGFGRV